MHLSPELYRMMLRGILHPAHLLRAAHDHLLQRCPPCRLEWEVYREENPPPTLLDPPSVSEPASARLEALPEHSDHLTTRHIGERSALVSRLRKQRRLARKDLNILLDLPRGEWDARVEVARSRFNSPALAEMLVEESHRRVRSDPREAERLATLVPRILHRALEPADEATHRTLLVRALAHRANALRAAGDLAGAERCFASLSRELERRPLSDTRVRAELCSLEASLRLEQRRFAAAERLLGRAACLYSALDEQRSCARVRLNQANLLIHTGDAPAALSIAEQLLSSDVAEDDPVLYLCAVHARIWALVELERHGEAMQLADHHRARYRDSEDRKAEAKLCHLQARAAEGLGDRAKAQELLERSRDLFLELGLHHAAADVALNMAHLLLEAGETEPLRTMASDLVAVFQAHGVEREMLASLALLARAAATDSVTRELLERVRGRLLKDRPQPQVSRLAGGS